MTSVAPVSCSIAPTVDAGDATGRPLAGGLPDGGAPVADGVGFVLEQAAATRATTRSALDRAVAGSRIVRFGMASGTQTAAARFPPFGSRCWSDRCRHAPFAPPPHRLLTPSRRSVVRSSWRIWFASPGIDLTFFL